MRHTMKIGEEEDIILEGIQVISGFENVAARSSLASHTICT